VQAAHYARIVADHARRRRLAEAAEQLREKALDLTAPDEEIAEALARVTIEGNGHFARGEVALSILGDIEPQAIEWLWPYRIPLGKLSLLAGDAGLGKSLLSLDIISRVTAGLDWPDGAGPAAIGNVLVLSAEDDPADTIRPRPDAAGGNARRVVVVEAIRDGDGERSFCLERDVRRLEDVITRVGGVFLVVADPLSGYLGTRLDSHQDAHVRSVLAPLAAIAERHGVAFLGISHLNKTKDASPLHRVIGSIAFTAAARAVWAVVKDKGNPRRRLLLPLKANLSPPDLGGLGFAIESDASGRPVLAWEHEPVNVSLDEAFAPPERPSPAVAEAMDWLANFLKPGPRSPEDIRKAAREAGVSWASVRRAKPLVARSRKDSFTGSWLWELRG